MSPSVILKKGREKSVLQKHAWIFSGAIDSLPSFEDGDFLPVYSFNRCLLGYGYFNKQSSIIGRMVSFDDTPPLTAIERSLRAALELRTRVINQKLNTGYRWVNGEGDGLPGLVIDYYDGSVVLQIATKGMERIKSFIVDWLKKNITLDLIYEKSQLPSRSEEGLSPTEGVLYGSLKPEMTFLENGLTFAIHLEKSQKTGFFLDHREMRQLVKEYAHGKRVLNAFSYTGGFSVYACSGGATWVDSVDISQDALQLAAQNMRLNGFEKRGEFFCEDVFDFLRKKELTYDLVILDPPAFAKRKKDVIAACRGYKDINRVAMQKMPSKTLLLTSSCSYHVSEELFQKVLFQAALEAKRSVRILARHRLAADHPISLTHRESDYLKSFLLYVE